MNDKWRLRKEAEAGVLKYLEDKNLPFQVPSYLPDRNGRKISRIEGNLYQVYPKIKGDPINNIGEEELKEIAKAIAIYHKTIRSYDPPNHHRIKSDNRWMKDSYEEKLRTVEPKNKLDRLMVSNLDFFEEALDKALSADLNIDSLMVHGDLVHADKSFSNLLFERKKLSGILDFENVRYQPKAYDIAQIMRIAGGETVISREYRRHNRLSKKEESNVNIFGVIHYCNMFRWYYIGMKKRSDLQFELLSRIIRDGREFIRSLSL